MDEAAPWRALEDPAPGPGGEASAAQPDARPRPPVWVLAAIVAAAVLIVAAFWLAASSGGGTVAVDGSTTAAADPTGDPGLGPSPSSGRAAGKELGVDVQGAVLRPGDQVLVPSRDDGTQGAGAGGPSGPGASSRPGTAAGPIDLNHATVSELDALPGIGPVTANKIVAARDERPFVSVDELRSRKILGAATFDKVKDLLVVR